MHFTIGIVSYHDADLLARALVSIVNLSDDIIIVYDGEPDAETAALAKKYNATLIAEPHMGGSDPHRLTILRRARYPWIFMLDSDEHVSAELGAHVRNLREEDLSAYAACSVFWPLKRRGKIITRHNTRNVLFCRDKVWAAALHNYPIMPVGAVRHIALALDHDPRVEKVGLSLFSGVLGKRLERDALSFAQDPQSVDTWNTDLIPESFWLTWERLRHGGFLYAVCRGLHHTLGSVRHMWRDLWWGALVSLQLGVYQYTLARRVWQKVHRAP
jgi:hypothetical protein